MKVSEVPLSEIEIGARERAMDDGWVLALVENIREMGLLQPIIVMKKKRGGYLLVDGRHRLEAFSVFGHEAIPASVLTGNRDEAKIREIDANLCRQELSYLDFCFGLKERKKIYEKLHPEAKHGGDRGNQHTGGMERQNGILPFWQETGERIGLSKSSVQRAVKVANDLAPGLHEELAGTAIAKSRSELTALSKLEKVVQVAAAGLIREGKADKVGAASLMAQGQVLDKPSADEKTLDKFMDLWDSAPMPVKRQILNHADAVFKSEAEIFLKEGGEC